MTSSAEASVNMISRVYIRLQTLSLSNDALGWSLYYTTWRGTLEETELKEPGVKLRGEQHVDDTGVQCPRK